jgi:hypothetical protein
MENGDILDETDLAPNSRLHIAFLHNPTRADWHTFWQQQVEMSRGQRNVLLPEGTLVMVNGNLATLESPHLFSFPAKTVFPRDGGVVSIDLGGDMSLAICIIEG